MKIAIHHRPGSFSDRWIEYCKEKSIEYMIVNAYDSNIIEQVKDCDAFMWHHHHSNVKDTLFAKQLIYSLETAGIRCFPDFHTVWHFDDKVGQKYLLEAIGAPLVPSYVFYTKKDALDWIEHTGFPKVFKLRGGAGSKNVMLVHNQKEARRLVKKAFGKGFLQTSINNMVSEDIRKHKEGRIPFFKIIKDIALYYLKPNGFHKTHAPEKGYAYFQDFIPDNKFDIRVVVVGDKAMGEKRFIREGDFRASGSGKFEYVKIREDVLTIAFELASELKLQSVAFDFIFHNDNPLIVEMSYGFGTHGISHCGGYYTKDLLWHEDNNPDFCGWMVDNILKQL